MLETKHSLSTHSADHIDSLADLIPSPADTFKSLVDFARRQYPVIVFAAAIAIALGLIYILTTPPSFTATTTMIIDSKKVQLFGQQSIFSDMPVDSSMIESQVEIIRSETIALAVIKKFNLADDPDFVGGGGGLIGTLVGAVTGLFASSEPPSEFTLNRAAVAAFENKLTIKRVGLTYVILISFQSHNPERAAEIANAVADAYIDDQLEAKFDQARRAGTWLQVRLKELREQASTAQSAVVSFKNKNDMVDAGGRTINEQQLAELNSELLVAQSQTSEARAKLDRVQSVLTSNDPEATVVATVADSLKNDVITKLRSQYLELSARAEDWTHKLGPAHLAVVNLRNQMREIQNSIRNELQRIGETYKSDFEIATQHEQNVRKQLNNAVAQSQVTSQAQVSLRDLESNAQTYRALYDNFLQRYMETVQQQSFPSSEARVITAATRPLSKSSPKTYLVLGLATLVGLGFGFVVASWRDFADRVFRTVHQVENALMTDCIALVPLLKNEDPKKKSVASSRAQLVDQVRRMDIGGIGRTIKTASQEHGAELVRMGRQLGIAAQGRDAEPVAVRREPKLDDLRRENQIPKDIKWSDKGQQTIVGTPGIFSAIVDSPFSAYCEAIRSIKIAIDLSPTTGGGRIIGFTSSVPNEGKSSTAAAVARLVAQTGAKSILVDGDLRNPTLPRSLSPRASSGLLQVVRGESTLEKAIWSDRVTGMKFLPAAMKARLAHTSEILASAQTKKFLDSLRDSYDYIFVDFSPLMPVVDVRVSTNLVDSYVYVVAWGETRIDFVKQALHSARGIYERLLGVVLNKVNLTAIDRYDSGGGYYYHRNYSRYGYTE